MEPIVVYVVADDKIYAASKEELASTQISEEQLQELFGNKLKIYAITLKEPLDFSLQIKMERACWNNGNPDPFLEPGARVEAYVAHWTFMPPPTAAGLLSLHPLIAMKINDAIKAAVTPSIFSHPDFFARLTTRPAPPSN